MKTIYGNDYESKQENLCTKSLWAWIAENLKRLFMMNNLWIMKLMNVWMLRSVCEGKGWLCVCDYDYTIFVLNSWTGILKNYRTII